MRTNKKMHKLIDITCSVTEVDAQQAKHAFLDEIKMEKHDAIIAMAKALLILSKGTVYESEVHELILRCSCHCDFTSEEINSI